MATIVFVDGYDCAATHIGNENWKERQEEARRIAEQADRRLEFFERSHPVEELAGV